MSEYRKKPVVIEAVQYTGQGSHHEFPPGLCRNLWSSCGFDCPDDWKPHIHTLEGRMTVKNGDWIIKGVKGEFYPCKPDIFEATYEPV